MLIINLIVIEIVINTMFTYPRKIDQKQFTAEVSYLFSRQLSQTEAYTHQSVSWDLKSVVHSLEVYDNKMNG